MTADLFPAGIVLAAAVAIKWLTDILVDAWPAAPKWAKRALAFIVAGCFVGACEAAGRSINIIARGSGLGYVLTAIVLAAVAGEVVHPLGGLVRRLRDKAGRKK